VVKIKADDKNVVIKNKLVINENDISFFDSSGALTKVKLK
jgi:hypothetical protein